jgi:hypothetical protein
VKRSSLATIETQNVELVNRKKFMVIVKKIRTFVGKEGRYYPETVARIGIHELRTVITH